LLLDWVYVFVRHRDLFYFPRMSCQTFAANLFRKPLVSSTGSITLMNVEAKTQINEMTIQPVKKPREKM